MTPQDEAKLQREITAELEKQAKLRKDVNESLDKWNEGVEKLKRKQKVVADLQQKIADLQEDIQKAGGIITDNQKIRLKILNEQLDVVEKSKTYSTSIKRYKFIKSSS
jgi:predicted  nucleic acid-binding Zn-ribbon protein